MWTIRRSSSSRAVPRSSRHYETWWSSGWVPRSALLPGRASRRAPSSSSSAGNWRSRCRSPCSPRSSLSRGCVSWRSCATSNRCTRCSASWPAGALCRSGAPAAPAAARSPGSAPIGCFRRRPCAGPASPVSVWSSPRPHGGRSPTSPSTKGPTHASRPASGSIRTLRPARASRTRSGTIPYRTHCRTSRWVPIAASQRNPMPPIPRKKSSSSFTDGRRTAARAA